LVASRLSDEVIEKAGEFGALIFVVNG